MVDSLRTEAQSNDLLTAGVPTDGALIQLLETLFVAGGATAIGGLIVSSWPITIGAAVIAFLSCASAFVLRLENIERNESDARFVCYDYPSGREDTIKGLVMPDDVKSAALSLVGQPASTRLEIKAKLQHRLGEERANEFLPVILQQADRKPAAI